MGTEKDDHLAKIIHGSIWNERTGQKKLWNPYLSEESQVPSIRSGETAPLDRKQWLSVVPEASLFSVALSLRHTVPCDGYFQIVQDHCTMFLPKKKTLHHDANCTQLALCRH